LYVFVIFSLCWLSQPSRSYGVSYTYLARLVILTAGCVPYVHTDSSRIRRVSFLWSLVNEQCSPNEKPLTSSYFFAHFIVIRC
jgi:hypothetical protein